MPGANIENLAPGGIRSREMPGPQQSLYDILNMDEVACLFAIAMDLHGVAAGRPFGKNRDDAGIRRVRVLPRAVHVEKSQANGRYRALPAGRLGIGFGGKLVDRIRREWLWRCGLGQRQRGIVPIDRGGTGIDDWYGR